MCHRLQIAYGIRNSFISGRNLQTVQCGKEKVEVRPELVGASCLAFVEGHMTFAFAELKFDLKTSPIDSDNVNRSKREIIGKEYLVTLLVLEYPRISYIFG